MIWKVLLYFMKKLKEYTTLCIKQTLSDYLANMKVITGERSSNESKFSNFRGKLFAWFQRYSDFIVCNSENAKGMWIREYPQYKKKLKTIYNTAELQEVTSLYLPKREGKTHIVIAASYSYNKNPIGVVKALSLLSYEEKSKIKIDW